MNDQPLGLPKGSVRALISLGVILGAGAVSGFLMVEDSGSDLAKVMVGGWIAALSGVVGYYFGSRQST